MKIVLLVSFAAIILQQHTSNGKNVEPQNTHHRVVIVGAGLSGYSAAVRLLANDFDDILVLEAENRIGGRVHSIEIDGGTIDMGAQWLHGQGGNIIYEMIGANFSFGDSTFENATYHFWQSDGTSENQTQIKSLMHLSETLSEEVYEQEPSYLGTFGSFFVANYWRKLRSTVYQAIPWSLALKVQNFFHVSTNNYFGTNSWFDISIAFYSTHGNTTGSQYVTWGNKGFKTVFEFLSRRRPDPSQELDVNGKIFTNKEVVNINWGGNVITLRCSDGSQYTADHIVFTASLGVLKDRHDSLFTPALPTEKVSVIEHSEFGSLEKIFLEFAQPINNSVDFAQYSILWTQDDINALLGTSREWLIDMAYFRRVDEFPNLLGTFFIGSRIADFDAFNETKIRDDCHWLLEKITGQTLPPPVNVHRSDWITKKNFMGAYSLFTMNSFHHGASPSELAKPVYDSNGRARIFFAGEHTSANFSGYTHGAVETGFRAGEEVLLHSSGTNVLLKYPMVLITILLSSLLKF